MKNQWFFIDSKIFDKVLTSLSLYMIDSLFVRCKKTSPNPLANCQVHELLTTLLSYPLEEVRLTTYGAIYDIVKASTRQ